MVNISNQVIPNRGLAPQAKASDVQILAAIDIGTNSVHMVVVAIEPSLPAFTIIAREKDTVRLGDRDRKTGKLTLVAMERAIAALKRCHDLAISLQADQIIAVATSATREAANGDEFLALIEKEVGISVNLISGQEEARRIYLGVVSGMDFQNQAHIIIDIGGGSTELILADSQEIRFLSSTKIGAVRLTQDLITTDPISPTELAYLRAYTRGMLERAGSEIKHHLQLGEVPRLVGTSGTIETLMTIHALEKLGEIPNPLNGYQLTRKDVKELVKRFATLDYHQRLAILGMSDKRAEIILAGSIVLLEAMTMLDVDKLVLCERALREGVIVDWMLTHGLIDNRLLYQSEIRQRSVLKIAKKYQVNLESAERIAAFSLSLFEQTQAQLHSWNQEAKDLLWAAAILHNSGLYVSHAAHHKHSYYLIRNGELLGYTEIELEVIANIARYHRKSKPKKRHDDFMKLTEYYQYMVRHLSAILRLAVALDRRQIGAIKKIECKYDPEYRTLHLHLFPNNAEDDCALELWSLDYKKPVFEEEFGVKVVATLAFLP
ncbi:MAG: Ppx/GppA family phosphatase [Microcystis aeruginosa L211-101]|jgi:exopolyphosphatase/guanosine-5'-triphosphate,3'-diphosphate pyrophosphatase|nr:Ppx/GppA family phosphatase [Microcystis aeruginosa L211-11]NCR29737.1 Ppx/GppA family phosphatase [Microcystis aeruginosa L211-101]